RIAIPPTQPKPWHAEAKKHAKELSKDAWFGTHMMADISKNPDTLESMLKREPFSREYYKQREEEIDAPGKTRAKEEHIDSHLFLATLDDRIGYLMDPFDRRAKGQTTR